MGKRHPDRADRTRDIGVEDLPERGVHSRLGDAVHIDQSRRARVALPPRRKALRLQRFPAEHHGLECELTADLRCECVSGLQCVERRRGLAQHSNPLRDE